MAATPQHPAIYENDPAFAPVERQKKMQDALLSGHVAYLAQHSPFYRQRFAEAGISPDAVQCVADLASLPLTSKEDLDTHGNDFLCVPRDEIVDVCLTSGTTASPVALLQTKNDLTRLERNEEQGFLTAGITRHDTVMICAAMDRCFMAGLAYFLGLVRIGATVVRAGSSSIPVALELLRSQRPTVIVGVPSLIKTLAERLQAEGEDPAAMGVQTLVCIGEPIRSQDFSLAPLGRRIHELWGARVHGTYASTELATGFTECAHGCGGHLPHELAVIELVDDAGHPVPAGQSGEIVATPLRVTGMPLLRFRTGDVAVLYEEPCACGRTTPRLGPILGRKSHMLKYRGTTVYPNSIFAVLQDIKGIQGYYLEVRDEYELSDQIRVVAGACSPELTATAVAERIAARTRVKPEVVLATPKEVADRVNHPDKRKPLTFFDYRKGRP